jgi:hypothetical protein
MRYLSTYSDPACKPLDLLSLPDHRISVGQRNTPAQDTESVMFFLVRAVQHKILFLANCLLKALSKSKTEIKRRGEIGFREAAHSFSGLLQSFKGLVQNVFPGLQMLILLSKTV